MPEGGQQRDTPATSPPEAPPRRGVVAPVEEGTPPAESIEGGVRLAPGTAHSAVRDLAIQQVIATLKTQGAPLDEAMVAQVLDLIDGIAPTNAVESMLASQMIIGHQAAVLTARRGLTAPNAALSQVYLALATKFMHLFATQLETLNRSRGKGTLQRVVVERVNVEPGGRAIVGVVAAGGGERGS